MFQFRKKTPQETDLLVEVTEALPEGNGPTIAYITTYGPGFISPYYRQLIEERLNEANAANGCFFRFEKGKSRPNFSENKVHTGQRITRMRVTTNKDTGKQEEQIVTP